MKQEYYYTMTSVEIEQLNEQIQNAQAKIIELQQKEAEEKAELEIKQTKIEPNMRVFSEWLESMELKKKEYEIGMQYSNTPLLDRECGKKLEKGINNEWGHIQSQKQHLSQKKTAIEFRYKRGKDALDRRFENSYGRGGVCDDDEYTIALEKLKNDKSILVEQEKIEKISSQKIDLFQTKNHKASDMPSEFMIQFIEATHNLFQIQQKRIEELEKKVYGSGENVNFLIEEK